MKMPEQIDMFSKSVKPSFGTHPRKLVRRTDPSTSVDGACAVKTSQAEKEVYDAIKSFGKQGCIATQVEKMIPHRPSHSITPRFRPLLDKGLIEECGKRMGDYGVEVRAVRVVT